MKEDISVEKLRKIEALRKAGSTEGERDAAAAALERVKSNFPLRITTTIIHVDKQEAFYEVQWGPHGERKRTSEANWHKPNKWNVDARAFKQMNGHRPRVFCASLADVFDNQVPTGWRRDLFALIGECRRLDWLLLTKRPQNISKMLPSDWGHGYRNVWLGVTAENQMYFDQRWKYLQNIPAVVKFISYEPALGSLRCRKMAHSRIGLYQEGKVGPERAR
jgi:protein gp37